MSCRPGFFLPVRVLEPGVPGQVPGRLAGGPGAGKLPGLADAAAFERWLGEPVRARLGGVCPAAGAGTGGRGQPIYQARRFRPRNHLFFVLGNHRLFWLGPRQTWFNLFQYHLSFAACIGPSQRAALCPSSPHILIDNGQALLLGLLAVFATVKRCIVSLLKSKARHRPESDPLLLIV